jgi:hypothetical protein
MEIWIILIIWMLLAGVFLLAICSAAARPIPQPGIASNNEHISVNSESEMQAPRPIKLTHMAAPAAVSRSRAQPC